MSVPLFIERVSSWSECYWPVAYARGGADGREECCERGYYHLHRQLDNTLFLHTRILFLPRKNTDEHRVFYKFRIP